VELSGIGLARRLEQAELAAASACFACWAAERPESGSRRLEVAGGVAFYYGSASPLSQALHVGMAGPVTADEFQMLESFFFGLGAPAVVSLCPYADAGLVGLLGRHRFRISHFEHTLVRAVPPDGPPEVEVPSGVTVEEAAAPCRRLWARTLMEGFADTEPLNPDMVEMFEVFAGAEGETAFLARVEGVPVGAAAMAVDAGTAMLFGDSTLPPWRGRGVHGALIAGRLRQAARAGCELAAAAAMPGSASQRNYERHGFRIAYTKAILVKDGM